VTTLLNCTRRDPGGLGPNDRSKAVLSELGVTKQWVRVRRFEDAGDVVLADKSCCPQPGSFGPCEATGRADLGAPDDPENAGL
jgi:hypothetical protein